MADIQKLKCIFTHVTMQRINKDERNSVHAIMSIHQQYHIAMQFYIQFIHIIHDYKHDIFRYCDMIFMDRLVWPITSKASVYTFTESNSDIFVFAFSTLTGKNLLKSSKFLSIRVNHILEVLIPGKQTASHNKHRL